MNNRHSTTPGWNCFCHHLARLIKLWLWVIGLLFLSRFLLVWQNRFSIDEATPISDYVLAFFTGFRFDMPVATIAILPAFLCASLTLFLRADKLASAVTAVMACLFTCIWPVMTIVTLIYFKEYHQQFDAHILGLVHDDIGAIVSTLWKTYPIVQSSLVLIAVCALLIWILRRWFLAPFPWGIPKAPKRLISKIGITLLILSVIMMGLRASLQRRPIQRKDAAQTQDSLLNRCTINPFSSLNYALKIHMKLLEADGLSRFLGKQNPRLAMDEYVGNTQLKTQLNSVDDVFLQTTQGRTGKKPRHIFLIVMESYSGWTMLEQHASWNISNELKKLGEEGIYVKRFLPGSSGTMTSLAPMIAGMADAGVTTNERSHPSQPAFGTAIAPQMERLGYQTHFWYAGYASWQRIGNFCTEQGFDYTHMATHMGTDPDINEWGVSDKHFFNHIKAQFNSEIPSFNIIMSSSNHPPFSLNLEKEGCPITSIPQAYKKDFEHGRSTLKKLGHHWYSDRCLGDFVRKISADTPDCLFAITGDHWGRHFPGPRPTKFESAIVPLVLYGPDVLPPQIVGDQLSGSHYDLGATLIEMAADPGFKYWATGKNILTSTPDDIAFSKFWLLSNQEIMQACEPYNTESLDGKKITSPDPSFKKIQRRYRLTHGISWWRIMKGNTLPSE